MMHLGLFFGTEFEINDFSADACEGYSSKKIAIFSFGDLLQYKIFQFR